MRKFLNVIIVDDEEVQIKLLKKRLDLNHKYVRIVATAENVEEAYKAIVTYKPDLVFLDIEMPPGANGFELAKLIRENKINTKIVIVSAKKEYAYAAIKISIFDYLHKPYSVEDLNNTLMKVDLDELLIDLNEQRAMLMHDVFEKISFKVGQQDYFVAPSEIIYCETKNNKSTLLQLSHLGKQILINETIKELETKLPKALFYRIKTSTLINIKYLDEILYHEKTCVLRNNETIYKLAGNEIKIGNLRKDLHKIY